MKTILALFLLANSSLVFARGSESIFSCNNGEVKMTQIRDKHTLESNKFGFCVGYANLVGGSNTTYLFRADLGSATCNRGLTIEWETPVNVMNIKTRTVVVTSKAGTELLECKLIKQGQD